MVRVSKERLVAVPFGAPEELNIYINGTKYDEFNTIKGIKKLNQQSFLEIELEDVTDTDTNVKKGNIILVFTNNKLFQKYTITHVNNMSDGVSKVIGEGSGEYSLRTKTVTRDVENESKFTDSTSANVVTQTCSGVINVGTNTEVGNITVRADYDNKLRLLSNTSKTLNGDWWFDQTDTITYATDQFNVSDFRGSQSSVFTLNQSGADQNMVESSREQDYDNLWNDVRVLGYGDGVNQITSRCFHATTKRTTLSADITATATTINFVDGSQFSSGDIIWIGMEKVTLTTVAVNQATGCTRGVTGDGAIDAYTHSSSISCYLYTRGATTYDNDTPENGSSIYINDPNQQVIQDKTIIDQNALDFAAQKILADHKDLVVRITCTVNDLYDFLDSVDIGDTVTLNDTDVGLSSNEYRVVGYELISDDDWEDLNIEISNRYTNLVEEIKGTQVDTDNLSKYMQGSTIIYPISNYDNCDDTHPVNLRFYIPPEAIGINKVLLKWQPRKYRIQDNGDLQVQDSAWIGGYLTNTGTNIGNTGSWYNVHTFSPDKDTSLYMMNIRVCYSSAATNPPSDFDYIVVRVYNSTDAIYYPSGGSNYILVPVSGYDNGGSRDKCFGTCTIMIPENVNGKSLVFQALGNTGGGYSNIFDFAYNLQAFGINGILETTYEATNTITVKVGLDGGSLSTVQTVTNPTEGALQSIDITSNLKNVGVGNWYQIQFDATAKCRIEANAYIQMSINSD
jgi:hypothetical protein